MLRTILVPLDGSRFGEHALPLALTLARKANARLHLVHSHQRLDSPYAEMMVFDDTLDDQMKRQEAAYLDLTIRNVQQHFAGEVTYAIEEGHTAAVIKHQAATVGADLIVLTTHARGPLARFWLGSVTDELVRQSDVPLLLAHPTDATPNLEKDVPLQHWLVPLDGTPLSEHILEPANQIADLFEADFTFLRVLRPVTPMVVPAAVGGFSPLAEDVMVRVESLQQDVERDAAAYLNQVAAPLRAKNRAVRTVVTVDEQAGEAILSRAKSGIDAIALGTHGRHGLTRMLLGSVADNVIRGSSVPVLVHRQKAL
jgi:nucleotide-binding universal stress UspA family protein